MKAEYQKCPNCGVEDEPKTKKYNKHLIFKCEVCGYARVYFNYYSDVKETEIEEQYPDREDNKIYSMNSYIMEGGCIEEDETMKDILEEMEGEDDKMESAIGVSREKKPLIMKPVLDVEDLPDYKYITIELHGRENISAVILEIHEDLIEVLISDRTFSIIFEDGKFSFSSNTMKDTINKLILSTEDYSKILTLKPLDIKHREL